ncbi:hypothetical protein [Thiolapillus sp.]
MVRIACLLLISLLGSTMAFASQAHNAIALSLKADEVEFGKPLRLVLKSDYSQPGLDTIDLSPLEKDFVIETPWDVQEDSHGVKQYWRIRLHARRPGTFSLPSLVFHQEHTRAMTVRITPAIDHTDNLPVRVHTRVETTAVWLNQVVKVSLTIENSSPHIQLETDLPRQSGLTIEQLPIVRHTRKVDGRERTLHRLSWRLYPRVSGNLKIQLPVVRYRRDGVTTHWFYPPVIGLHIRPLPLFVPPTLPVGRIEVSRTSPLPPVLLKNRLHFLTLQVKTPGAGKAGAAQVLRQFRNDGRITFHTPQQLSKAQGQRTYRIPYELNGMGLVTLPTLRLQYFDPTSGKLQTREQPLGSMVSLSPWVAYLLLFILLLGLLLISVKIYRWIQQRYHRYRNYRKALHLFNQADSASGFKEGIREIARAEHWPVNTTLNAWLEHWTARYPQAASMARGIGLLQSKTYAGTGTDLDEIRPFFTAVCYQQEPWLRVIRAKLKTD